MLSWGVRGSEDQFARQSAFVAFDETSKEGLGFYLFNEPGELDAELDILFVAP